MTIKSMSMLNSVYFATHYSMTAAASKCHKEHITLLTLDLNIFLLRFLSFDDCAINIPCYYEESEN